MSWIKCIRILTLNSLSELLDLEELIYKILNNILINIDEIKYRELKQSNKLVQDRILKRKGGLELLSALNFTLVSRGEEKLYVMNIDGIEREEIVTRCKNYISILR